MKCPNCAAEMEYNSTKCSQCSYSGMPLSSIAGVCDKIKLDREEPAEYERGFDLKFIFSRLALVSFFVFIVSLGYFELESLLWTSLAGFMLFSIFYGFLRFKDEG